MFKKDRGETQQSQSPDWRQRRWCCVSGGIRKKFSTMNCCRQANWFWPLLSTTNAIEAIDSKKVARIDQNA